jgi:hypothetical protein
MMLMEQSSTLAVATMLIVIIMRWRRSEVMECVGHSKGSCASSPTHSTAYYPAASPNLQPVNMAPTLPHHGHSNYSQGGWPEPKPYGNV